MTETGIHLRVLLPNDVFIDAIEVSRVVAPTVVGAFGIYPRRQDCVVAVKPGVLTYQTGNGPESYIAVDEGVLVKTGATVEVAVRNAIRGAELGKLHEAVEREFLNIDEREREIRSIVDKLEASLVRRMVELHRA